MINATGLELRAGARILLAEATLRVQPGDRIGLVGRNGAGKTTTLKVLAGEGSPVRRRGRAAGPGRLPAAGPAHRRPRPSPPATGCSPPAAWTRILAEMKQLEAAMADDPTDQAVRRYGALEDQFAGLGGYAAEAEAARICANLGPARPGAGPDDRHALRRPAPPHRAGPHPVRRRGRDRRRHAAARRADQPPRRRLDHLAARLPRPATRAA